MRHLFFVLLNLLQYFFFKKQKRMQATRALRVQASRALRDHNHFVGEANPHLMKVCINNYIIF